MRMFPSTICLNGNCEHKYIIIDYANFGPNDILCLEFNRLFASSAPKYLTTRKGLVFRDFWDCSKRIEINIFERNRYIGIFCFWLVSGDSDHAPLSTVLHHNNRGQIHFDFGFLFFVFPWFGCGGRLALTKWRETTKDLNSIAHIEFSVVFPSNHTQRTQTHMRLNAAIQKHLEKSQWYVENICIFVVWSHFYFVKCNRLSANNSITMWKNRR